MVRQQNILNRSRSETLHQLSEYRLNKGLTWQALSAQVSALNGAGAVHESTLRLSCKGTLRPTERILRKIELFLEKVAAHAA